jgi:ankyrin repeat protein
MKTDSRSPSSFRSVDSCLSPLLVAVALTAAGCATLPKVDQDLLAAVRADNVAEAERLLAAGANINGRSVLYHDGSSPLAWAAEWGAERTAEWLLARGADVNEADRHGATPLHIAAYRAQPAVAALLLRHGANVSAQTQDGWTPLQSALARLAFAPATATPSEVEVAKVAGIMKLLLASGARVDVRGSAGVTPLHLAALTGQRALVRMLIDSGADVGARSNNGSTPLYQAAKKDAPEVVELLLARGAAVDARIEDGSTPLSAAAEWGDPQVAKVLLDHAADLNARDKGGATPLVSACRSLVSRYALHSLSPASERLRPRFSLVEIERARVELRDENGKFGAVARLLIDHGADPNVAAKDATPLRAAAIIGDRALAEDLIQHGASVDVEVQGETPLHAAIAESHGDVAELLIDKGANVNARNMSQRTPLHFLAAFMHDGKLAALLIQNGADVNAKDRAGHTPLENAVRIRNNEVAEVLRQHGAG